MLSPHYQMTYYLLVAAGLWTVFLVFFDPERPTGRPWAAPLGLALAAVLLGIAVAAIQVLPFLQYLPYSPRAAGGPSGGWAYATGFSMPPEEIVTTILPQFNGVLEHYWGRNFFKLHTEYLGAVVVVLAGATMYALLRGLRTGWIGCVVGGLSYELTGIVASLVRPGHDGKL
ncbi:MAG: hypothetical protein JF602_09750, partial [Gemmatimonadetes bacterium]|nr:hypothetical protein [Gemmatimonadota bacterium]